MRNTIKKVAAEVCPFRAPLQQYENLSSSHFPDRYKNSSNIAQRVAFFDRYEIVSPDFWNTYYENFTFWINGITSKIVPCFLLTVFMALLVQVIVTSRKSRRKLIARKNLSPADPPPSASSSSLITGADRTTVILLSIVFIFWLTELPQGVLLIGSSFDKAVFHAYRLIGDALDLLSLVNSTVNFMLYCSMSAKFRQEIWRMVLQCVGRGRETTTGPTIRDKKSRSGKRIVFGGGQNGSSSVFNRSNEKSEYNTYNEREYVELPVIPERCTEED
uniref:G-protein coupled receptors family 1 profile domain-containing protein n=1 Tax=Romanomermis culicivorax TaxID=13658 RepID=A0A915KBZ3_ROMCU